MKRMYLYPQDIMILTGKQYKTCLKNYHLLLDVLGKKKGTKLTIREYCELEDVNEKEVREHLNLT